MLALLCLGCRAPAAPPQHSGAAALTTGTRAPASSPAPAPVTPPLRLDSAGELDGSVANRRVSLFSEGVPLAELLREIADAHDLELIIDDSGLADLTVTLRATAHRLGDLLDRLESAFPVEIERRGRLLRVRPGGGPRLSLLIYPLPGGLVSARSSLDFDSIRQLSFISRSQRESGGEAVAAVPTTDVGGGARASEGETSHLEEFLARLPELFSWPAGSTWFVDKRRNLLFVRSSSVTLDQVEECLERLVVDPVLIEIETRFLEVSEDFARELGVELALTEPFGPDYGGFGDPRVFLGDTTATKLGIVPGLPGDPFGLNLSVLGVLSEPRFEALLRALETHGDAEVLSAPAVTTVNNSRATIAITTNLPFIEDFRPVFDTRIVAADGISTSDANVALVAVINDRNFTGIVLDVTPSVGSRGDRIQLRLQPVVRDQVDSITIPSGALVEGVETPDIARPIIETRFLDTQLSIPSGASVALGGLQTTETRQEVRRVPFLASIPLLGRFFRRETEVRVRRDLLILVSATVVGPSLDTDGRGS